MVSETLLDVSDREPPEPLVVTLAAVERIGEGEYLRMRHRRFPCLLFDNLDGKRFAHLVRGGDDVACEVFIWRRGDVAAGEAARAAASRLPEWRE